MSDFRSDYLSDMQRQFTKLRHLAERAMAQVDDAAFMKILDADGNSIATLVKHISGNLRSRCTDFLTTDGEKPFRDRDGEFLLRAGDTRVQLLAEWAAAWDLLASTVNALTPEDLHRTIYVRAEPLDVAQALNRHLAHLAYHVGQIVLLAKHWLGGDWRTLTIPRGESEAFNRAFRAEQERHARDRAT